MAATAFYATLVLSQFVHVFVCKTRFVPMLEHGVFNNSMMNYGVMVELGIMIAVIFIPHLDTAFFANPATPFEMYWFFLLSGMCLIAWGELRKYLIRSFPTSRFASVFAF